MIENVNDIVRCVERGAVKVPSYNLVANRKQVSGWEAFELCRLGDGKVAFKSFHGNFICAKPDGTLNANSKQVSGWEAFELCRLDDGKVAFKSFHGNFICTEPAATLRPLFPTTRYEEKSALEALDTFNDELKEYCNLYEKPIAELNVQECRLLYNIANIFYILDLNKIFPQQCTLDKTIDRLLQEDYKPLFIYAREWNSVVAVVEQKHAIVQKLLEYRVQIEFDVNEFITDHKQTLLHLAVKYKVDDEIVASLINAGANIYIEDKDGYTPFGSYPLAEDEIKYLPVLYQQEYDVHLPVPTSSLWNARLHLNKLFLKWQEVEFFKNEMPVPILHTLNPEQLAADLYVLVTITDDAHIALKKQQLKNLERELMTELNCKEVVVIIKNGTFSNTVTWKEVLHFGEKQQTLLNEVKVIIKEHDLDVFDASICELQNVPTLPFLEMLSPKQKQGFIKLGNRYFSIIGGMYYRECDQDRVFSLLVENEKVLVRHAFYWNLYHICKYKNIDESLLEITRLIIKALKTKQVDFDINYIDEYGKTCLDYAIKKLYGERSGSFSLNGQLCVLLLKHGAKAVNNIRNKGDDVMYENSQLVANQEIDTAYRGIDENYTVVHGDLTVVPYQNGKIILSQDHSFNNILQTVGNDFLALSINWIDKNSPDQVLLRKIADNSHENEIIKIFTENKLLKYESDKYENLPTHWVAISGRSELIPIIKDNCCDMWQANKFGLLPLHMAVIFNQATTLKELIKTFGGSDRISKIKYRSLDGSIHEIELNPFHLAVLLGREEIISLYLDNNYKGLDPNINGFGTIFHLVVSGGQTPVLNHLFNHPKLRNESWGLLQRNHEIDKLPVLSYAAALNKHWIVNQLLNSYQIRPEWRVLYKHDQDQSALIAAVKHGAIDSVKMLVGMDVKVDFNFNHPNKEGTSSKNITLERFTEKMLKQEPNSCERKDIQTFIKNVISGHKENKDKILDVKQRHIRNLVFQGGGIKGVALAGGYKALDYILRHRHKQTIEDIECVAGTSAGAIFALTVSVGIPPDQLIDLLRTAPFSHFLDDVKPSVLTKNGFWPKMSGLFDDILGLGKQTISFVTHPLTRSLDILKTDGLSKGEIIMGWLSKVIATHLLSVMEEEGITPLANFIRSIPGLEEARCIDLQQVPAHGLDDKQLLKLNFGHLKELIKFNPKRFKHLFTVALRLQDQECSEGIEVMSSWNNEWREVLIIDAVRASMSIPVVFIPHQVRTFNEHGVLALHSNRHYVDGGALKNYPIELFDRFKYLPKFSNGDDDKYEPNPFTVGFRLFTPEELKQGVESGWLGQLKAQVKKLKEQMQHAIDKNTAIGFMKTLANLYYNAEDIIAEFQNVRAGRTINISNNGIDTLQFDLSEPQAEALIISGEQAICEAYEQNYQEYKALESRVMYGFEAKQNVAEDQSYTLSPAAVQLGVPSSSTRQDDDALDYCSDSSLARAIARPQ